MRVDSIKPEELPGLDSNILSRTLETLPNGIDIVASAGQFISSNVRAQQILGLTRAQLHGRSFMDSTWRIGHEDGIQLPHLDHPSLITLCTGEALSGVITGVIRPAVMARLTASVRPRAPSTA